MMRMSFIQMKFTIRVPVFIFIIAELTVGKLYAIDRNLGIKEIKYLAPVVQHLEIPEVPPEYEDDDKPSK